MPSIIEQIATELNISNASVSRALNDRPGVSKELRQRVLQRARALHYTPNITARGLATSQTFGIGFFVREKLDLPTQTDPFYGEILQGVEQACAQTDYHVTIATLTDMIIAAPMEFRFVRERRIDGMILAGPDIPNDFIVAMLHTDIALVLVDNKLDYSPINSVNSDDEHGGYLAARHLIDSGHRDIGVITGPKHWPSNARRVRGYWTALQEADLPLQIVHEDCTTIESGKAAYEQLMAAYPNVTGICAVNDAMAIGALQRAQQQGRSIPDNLSVVGFDDIAWASLNTPPLTTVSIPKRQLGQEAAKRLLLTLNDPDTRPVEVVVSVQFIPRGSSQRIR